MSTRDNKSIQDDKKFEQKLNEKRKKDIHKRKIYTKKVNSNLNLKLSLLVFIVMVIVALVIVLNKGKFGNYSLIFIGHNDVHTAELECENYYISVLDKESTAVTVTVDGVTKNDGYELKSSDENIAKIENNMVVAGDTAGVATITAYFEEYDMNISTDILSYIPINTITATISNPKLSPGKEAELDISIIPKDGTDEYISYSSNNKSVATVNDEGIVTGVSEGEATITIKDELTGASATKIVTVK